MRSAVLDATIEMLTEQGYEDLSIEAVASRAGVHKTTVYRRWPTKANLIAAATRSRSEDVVPLPDTGTLHGDLRELARSIATNLGSPLGGQLTRTMVVAASTSAEVEAGTPLFWAERVAGGGELVRRAVERGELSQGADANLIIETLMGPLFVRLLLTGEPITVDFADRVADLVAAGAAHVA